MFIKIIDLLDTVFFVLRKKQSHITVLHVYHHTCMAVGTWAFVKYTEGQQCVLIGVINSAVHAVMYGYYLLSALGPQVQKYLWWKKYITKLQMGQFIVIMGYLLRMLLYDNNLPKIVIIGLFTNTGVFLALFYDFYRKSYFKPTKQVAKFSN
nr:PREDICTED: elongation of very long chain fatty acids protein AAEL008004-like isoform X3 [Bemisia tabaci]XP_018914891.1 PREDICTED: elongation of very long chain fatty acids protein AAEL008004-like isoform X3 [Bemisia tabaci]